MSASRFWSRRALTEWLKQVEADNPWLQIGGFTAHCLYRCCHPDFYYRPWRVHLLQESLMHCSLVRVKFRSVRQASVYTSSSVHEQASLWCPEPFFTRNVCWLLAKSTEEAGFFFYCSALANDHYLSCGKSLCVWVLINANGSIVFYTGWPLTLTWRAPVPSRNDYFNIAIRATSASRNYT